MTEVPALPRVPSDLGRGELWAGLAGPREVTTEGAGRALVGGASLRCDRVASAGFSLATLYLPHLPPTALLVGRSLFSSRLRLSCLPEGREGGGQAEGLRREEGGANLPFILL